MKRWMVLFVFCLPAVAASAQTGAGYINMTPAQFQTALANEKSVQLIDVRQDWEFTKGHLANAQNIDVMAEDFDQKVAALPKDKPVYVYCYSGGRSGDAAEKLKALGFKKVVNLSGGYAAWEKALLPVVK